MSKWCNARSEKDGLEPVYTVNGAVLRTGTTVPTVNWGAKGYRLPTEAEWEKASRGGLNGKRFPWGDSINHTQRAEETAEGRGLGRGMEQRGVAAPIIRGRRLR